VVAALAVTICGTGATAAHAAPSKSDLAKQIQEQSDKLENVTEQYNKMNIDLKKTVEAEKQLAASLQPAKDALKAATAQMGSLAATAYKTGQVGAMSVLLDGDGSDLMEKLTALDQVQRRRTEDIASYTTTTQTYAERQAALKATQLKQVAEVKQLAAAKQTIQTRLDQLYRMRKAAYGRPTEVGHRYTGAVPHVAGSAGVAVAYAYRHLGDPYVYAASGPRAFDCSGLTMAAWAAAGRSLPHNAAAQWGVVSHIGRGDLRAGDLVFYRGLGHVALYVGNGRVIHAPHAGTVVKLVSVDIMPPYGYGRV
jgi:peptidoglycan DL-endopeptidase CwlO